MFSYDFQFSREFSINTHMHTVPLMIICDCTVIRV